MIEMVFFLIFIADIFYGLTVQKLETLTIVCLAQKICICYEP